MTEITSSSAFLEHDPAFTIHEGNSFKSRIFCFSLLIKKLLLLPFTLFAKAFSTFFRILGIGFGLSSLFFTLGLASSARHFFIKRMLCLGSDLADWVLFPFAIAICFLKLILGGLISPSIYYRTSSC